MIPDSITFHLVAKICNADSVAEAIAMYAQCWQLVGEYRFVFASVKGATPGYAVNRTFGSGAAVRSVFATERVFVLDPETFREMQVSQGPVHYPVDFSISLDTQALSYLEPYMNRSLSKKIPNDFKEVFEFIARDEVNVDPLPYINENRFNLVETKAADRVFAKLKSYEVLRTLDKTWLETRGEVRSVLTKNELDARALKLISDMYEARRDNRMMEDLYARHQMLYLCLMKMASIQLRTPRLKLTEKVIDFMSFCDGQLATMFAREIAIARAYFQQGQKLTFFGKVQKGRADLLQNLSNMAWDLLHIRHLEEGMTLKISPGARYFFTSLLTFDKRLIEIIDLYPLRSLAYKTGGGGILPVYSGDWLTAVAPEGEARPHIEQFFSEAFKRSRDSRREACKADLPRVTAKLEAELVGLSA